MKKQEYSMNFHFLVLVDTMIVAKFFVIPDSGDIHPRATEKPYFLIKCVFLFSFICTH